MSGSFRANNLKLARLSKARGGEDLLQIKVGSLKSSLEASAAKGCNIAGTYFREIKED